MFVCGIKTPFYGSAMPFYGTWTVYLSPDGNVWR